MYPGEVVYPRGGVPPVIWCTLESCCTSGEVVTLERWYASGDLVYPGELVYP